MHAKLQKIQNYLTLSMSSQGKEINTWSLTFKDDKIESDYRQLNSNQQLIIFNFSIALMLYKMVSSVYTALCKESISKNEIIFFLTTITQTLVFLVLINLKKTQAHGIFFIFQMLTSSAIAVKIYKNNFQTDSQAISLENPSIQAITYMSFLCMSNLGSTILIKISCFFLSCLGFFIAFSLKQIINPQDTIQLVLVFLLYTCATYQHELRQRDMFLKKRSIKNYLQKISEFTPYCLITGRFDSISDKIQLLECNSKANKELDISNEEDLEGFLGSTFLRQKLFSKNKSRVQEELTFLGSNFNIYNNNLQNNSQDSKNNNNNNINGNFLSKSPCFKTNYQNTNETWRLDFEEIEQMSTIENSLKTYLLKLLKEESESEKGLNKSQKKQKDKEEEEKAFNDSNTTTIKEQLSPFKLTSNSVGNSQKLMLFQVDRVQNTCIKLTAKISIFKWNTDSCFVITMNAKKNKRAPDGGIPFTPVKTNYQESDNNNHFLRPISSAALMKMASNEDAKGEIGERDKDSNSSKIVRDGRSGSQFTLHFNNSINTNEMSPNNSFYGSQTVLKLKSKQVSKKQEQQSFNSPTEQHQIVKEKNKKIHLQMSTMRILSSCVRETRKKLEELLVLMVSQNKGNNNERKLTISFDYLRSFILNIQLISSSMMAYLQIQDMQSQKKHKKLQPFKTPGVNFNNDLEQVNIYNLKNSLNNHFGPLFAQENIPLLISFDDIQQDKMTMILSHRLHLQLLIANLIAYTLQLYKTSDQQNGIYQNRAQQTDDNDNLQSSSLERRFVAFGLLPGNYQQNEVLIFFLQIPDGLDDNFEYLSSSTGVEGLKSKKNVKSNSGASNQDIFYLELPKILLKNLQQNSSLSKGIFSDKIAEGVKKNLVKVDNSNKLIKFSQNCSFLDQGNSVNSNVLCLQGSSGLSPSNRSAVSPSNLFSPQSETTNQELDYFQENKSNQFIFRSEYQNSCGQGSKTQLNRSDIEIAEERNQENMIIQKDQLQNNFEFNSENYILPSSALNSTNSISPLVREQQYKFQSVLPGIFYPNQGKKPQQQIELSIYNGYNGNSDKSNNSAPDNQSNLLDFRVINTAGRKTISFFLGDINSLNSKMCDSSSQDFSQLQEQSLDEFTRWVDLQLRAFC